MDIVVSFVMPLIFILGISLFNSVLFKLKFEVVVAFSLIESILITYILGFVDLRLGFVCSVIMSLVSVPLLIYNRKKQTYSFRDYFNTDMLWVFILLYSIIFALNLGKTFYKWDEFSHWGMMAKEMFRLDKYYFTEESVLVFHRDYPPFTTILQYIWCKLCGDYKERHLYNAKIILSLVTFFPVYSWFIESSHKSKNIIFKILKAIGISIFFILASNIMTIGEAFYYRTIYTEGILCALIFLALFCLFTPISNYSFHILNIGLVLSAVMLTKQIGVYFAVFIIVGFFLFKLIRKDKLFKITESFVVIVLPSVLWLYWQIVTKMNAPVGQFDSSKFSIEKIIEIFNGGAPEYRYSTIKVFIDAIFNFSLIEQPIKISYVGFLFLFPILVLFCVKICKSEEYKRKILVIGSMLEFTAILYMPVMLVLYLFGFGKVEAIGLACYDRYMKTMLYPMILFMFFILLGILLQEYSFHRMKIWTIGIASIIMFIPFSNLKVELLPGLFSENVSSLFQGDAEILIQNTNENDSIYFVCQEDNGSARNITAYLTSPRTISTGYFSVTDDEVDAVVEYMKDYDYVYLSGIDSVFTESYGYLFGENFEEKNQQLYKITMEEERLSLERVY